MCQVSITLSKSRSVNTFPCQSNSQWWTTAQWQDLYEWHNVGPEASYIPGLLAVKIMNDSEWPIWVYVAWTYFTMAQMVEVLPHSSGHSVQSRALVLLWGVCLFVVWLCGCPPGIPSHSRWLDWPPKNTLSLSVNRICGGWGWLEKKHGGIKWISAELV